MQTFELYREQYLGIDIQEAWDFFKNPKNLSDITPDHLGFDIKTQDLPQEIYEGLFIEYRVKPILGIPMKWLTKITDVKHPYSFVDEQKVGPYKLWRHTHTFEAVEGGVLMKDEIKYALPLGWIGRLFHPILIQPQLAKIFDFRFEYLKKKFPITIDLVKSN